MGSYTTNERAAVLGAIDDGRFSFRTIGGIAEETGVGREVIQEVLVDNPKRVRLSLAMGPHGEFLYTRRDKPVSWRERVATLQQMIALI